MLEHTDPEVQQEAVSNADVESEYRPVPALSLALGYVHRTNAMSDRLQNDTGM